MPSAEEPTDVALAEAARQIFAESVRVKTAFAESQLDVLVEMSRIVAAALEGGGKLLFCGNGGSAADAQHLAAELLVRLRPEFNRRPLPALALALDSSTLTACANDYSFEDMYARMVEALATPGDVLIAISTSGRSENVLRALRAARARGLTALGFLGGDGGPARAECDHSVVVDAVDPGRVQETHIAAGHAMLELVETLLLQSGSLQAAVEG